MTEQGAVPPGYKRTEVGVIPEDWLVLSLGELGTFMKGKGIKRDDISNDGLLCIRYGELYTHYNNYVIIPQSRISEKIAATALPIKKGDLLFAGSGETAEEIGKCVAYLGDQNAFAGGDIVVLRSSGHNSLYLGHLLNHDVVAQQKARYGQGDAVVHISSTNLAKVKVPLSPNKNEQHAIAAALSDVDGLIGALDALIAKKRDMKQAAMQQLLTGRTRLPGFEGEWEEKRLGNLAEIDPENLSNSTNLDYCFNYISLEQVDNGRLIGYSEEVFRSSPSRARRKLKKGDVLMSTVRPNLMSHLLYNNQVNNAVCSTGFAVIRAKVGLSEPGFLFNQLFGYVVNNQIEKIIAGSNYPAINSRDVKMIKISCPPSLPEQTAIATVLSDMDAEIAALECRRDKAKEIKQGMMQQLLTGKVRLVSPEEMGEHNNNMVQA